MNDELASLLAAIEGLRSDMREDLQGIRDELRTVEHRMVDQVTAYTSEHAILHAATEANRDEAHARYDTFIRAQEIQTARREGALGVARFMVELVARNSGAIVKVVLALASAVLVLNGNVSVSVQ